MKKRKVYRLALAAALVLLAAWSVHAATTTSNVKVQSTVRATATGSPATGSLVWDIGTGGVKSIEFSNGSGALAVNKVFVATAATTTTYDLDGSLVDPAGTTISFSRIAYMRIVPNTANSAALALSGDFILTKYLTANGDTLTNVTIQVNKSGYFEFAAPDATGIAVTATTGDQVTITVTGSDSFTIVILGS